MECRHHQNRSDRQWVSIMTAGSHHHQAGWLAGIGTAVAAAAISAAVAIAGPQHEGTPPPLSPSPASSLQLPTGPIKLEPASNTAVGLVPNAGDRLTVPGAPSIPAIPGLRGPQSPMERNALATTSSPKLGQAS
jgi:hypothetical protein